MIKSILNKEFCNKFILTITYDNMQINALNVISQLNYIKKKQKKTPKRCLSIDEIFCFSIA